MNMKMLPDDFLKATQAAPDSKGNSALARIARDQGWKPVCLRAIVGRLLTTRMEPTMRRILALIFALSALHPAYANDLPEGDFLLTGPVLPGIQEGYIVPITVHASIRDNRIHWSLMTSYGADAMGCETHGKCDRINQSLVHHVTLADDGTLSLDKIDRERGKHLTVDRPDEDETYVFGALNMLIDGAKLTLTEQGGTLHSRAGRRATARKITLHPLSLEQTQQALAFILSFEVSLAQMNHCAIRQFAEIAAKPNPDPIESEILAAARFYGEQMELNDLARYYVLTDPPAELADEVALASGKYELSRAMLFFGSRLQMLADEAEPLSDAQIWTGLAQEFTQSGLAARFEKEVPGYFDEIVSTRADEILAALKIQQRFANAMREGQVPLTLLCSDLRMAAY